MAYTVSTEKTVFGNQRTHFLTVTADAATQNVDSGLSYITAMSYCSVSMASAPNLFRPNVGAESTALVGWVGVSGVASGDEFILVCHGR